ncbi:MAG: hypothetical protein AAGH76_15900 [Pseudomonadota bacterium]
MNTQRQLGLTLIDTAIVVAAFCSVAAIALPRFAMLDEASRLSAVRTLADDIRSTAELSHSIWVSAGRPAALTRDTGLVRMVNGYPDTGDMKEMVAHSAFFHYADGEYHYADGDRVVGECYVSYQPPEHSLDGPDIAVIVSGC